MTQNYLPPEIEAFFPHLRRAEYRKTSEATPAYNCIAHAAEVSEDWWWPAEGTGIYWPPGTSMEETIESFVHAYATVGYSVCEAGNRDPEVGYQKIAIYTDSDGVPTHAARQLPNGEWTSKLGRAEDIQHRTLGALGDEQNGAIGYGRVTVILRRPME